MKSITIKIKTENEAFVPNPNSEIARILRGLATRIEIDTHVEPIRDTNGNKVGKLTIK